MPEVTEEFSHCEKETARVQNNFDTAVVYQKTSHLQFCISHLSALKI